ncbi:MAG: hypothetical protein A2806_04625 [Candidatus Terrybacteria bacterium RIFCSPHIGHO2_01_FULL_48_17]|uniref:Putative pre-16S rRNA nuclease n=1 Tax=Candidatus Terrybacteria bacterium RIFCSPHIGHO2_01_FULL_48_17 TaxID=1802362 RepID=A0A1G2PKV5_9BACT|nr:MAG: hypothetical protein A2806_04625 [Candidatus Terrybacteria bacterium RIFCSPHIGHO2_01_FULL_48_17]OHA52105.1 MAG: hypothetical protein A3A30_04360 [Candidatus Terrybacteria bacterium RIFCSPLOWO2_01_FULL_48_14]
MRILAIDHGSKRIGLAVGDTGHGVATPLKSIGAHDVFGELRAFVAKENIERIVIGMPLTLRGEKGAQAQKVEAFGKKLGSLLNLPVEFFDERLTSKMVLKDTQDKDAAAAAILLSDWLQAYQNKKT